MPSDRDKLIEAHLPLVHSIAGKLKRSLGRTLEYDDLIAYGSRGLTEAAERFDTTKGAAFSTFAYYRIRGAMLDGMRTMGWYSRSDYARYRAEERTHQYLQSESDQEAAAAPAESPAETLGAIAEVLQTVAAVHVIALDSTEDIEDETLPAADEHMGDTETRAAVRDAVAQLPDNERVLLERYYFQDETLESAGAALGLSKSWACRLHARAVKRLAKALAQHHL
jgi:RNA polymerase sigma factor for flagellar operon FliA